MADLATLAANNARNQAWAIPGPYETPLNPNQEKDFRNWVAANKIPFDPDEKIQDYDMRGFYKAMLENKVARDPNNMHFPDTFKTPYHESFSNESQYANFDAPRWIDNRLIDRTGNVVFDESQAQAR